MQLAPFIHPSTEPKVPPQLKVLDLDLVTRLVAPNPSLTDRVLRMANSVSFNRGVPVRSLSEAVARLGFEQLLQLIARPEANSDAPA